jgi:hypothetical protein
MKRRLWVVGVVLASACACACSTARSTERESDALAIALASPYGAALREPLPLRGLSFRASAFTGAFPARATDDVVLVAGAHRVSIALRDVPAATVHVTHGVATYALGGRSSLWTASRDALEELQVVHAAQGDYSARYRIGAAGLTARVRDRRVELLDARGRLVLGTAPVEAADADGVRRALEASVVAEVAEDAKGAEGAEGEASWSLTITGSLEGMRPPIVVDPVWSTVGSLATARKPRMAAASLSDGRVLAFGGYASDGTTILRTAEVFDPKTNLWSWAGTAPLDTVGGAPFLVELPSKKVLATDTSRAALIDVDGATVTMLPVAWTFVNGAARVGSEVWIFANDGTWSWHEGGSFTARAPMPEPVLRAAAAALPDGRILVSGGSDLAEKVRATSWIYDPKADAWTSTAPMLTRRQWHALIPLPSGKVLAIGGANALYTYYRSIEIFDPSTGTWAAGATMPIEPCIVNALAPNAAFLGLRMYVVGSDGRPLVYDTARDFWAEATGPSLQRSSVALGSTGDGRIVMIGGQLMSDATAQTDALTPLAAGSTCGGAKAGDCATGLCVDAVCCAEPCAGACQRCDVAGSVGVCTAIATPRTPSACAPYAACAAGACEAGCSRDADCLAGSFCQSGACVPRFANGAACAASAQCASSFCVDAVCCRSACAGNCEACDTSGDGTCVPVAGTPRGARPACVGGGDPQCGKVCDGVHGASCSFLPAGSSPCGVNGCSAGVETRASTCDGAGACAAAPKSCGAYGCGPTACRSACLSGADCAAGHVCISSACVPAPGLGTACTGGDGCATGHCVDGVCCASSSCGAGSVCNAAGHEGFCRETRGLACALDDDCASGFCVDGVCCDARCGGQCQACDLPGQGGTCAPVTGAPRGARVACSAGDGSPCGARTCDGKDVGSCAGFAPRDVSCRIASCAAGASILAARCDGKGACPPEETRSCGLLRCAADATHCLSVCSTDGDCKDGYACVGGQCRGKTTSCADDGVTAVKSDGTTVPCSPFACRGGACVSACAASSDCAAGFLCDNGACVGAATGSDGGGCSVSTSKDARGRAHGGLAALVLGAALALRRRRAGRARRRAGLVLLAASALGCDATKRTELGTSRQAVAGEWTVTSETTYPHAQNLSSGTYMIGHVPGGAILGYNEVAETFDGAKWSVAQVLPQYTHWRHVAELAPGRFLIFGGMYNPGAGMTADLLPSLLWQPLGSDVVGGSMNEGRSRCAFAVLSTGQVLAAGGFSWDAAYAEIAHSSAELYDPTSNAWTLTGPLLATPRVGSIVVPLAAGGALLVGDARVQSERFDPATKTWSAGPSTSSAFDRPLGATLTSGRFLLADRAGAATPELYDPATHAFKRVARPADDHANGVLFALPADRAILAGGSSVSSIEVYEATTDRWVRASPMARPRQHGFAIDVGGKILIAAGSNGDEGYLYDSELFDPRANGRACGADGDCQSLHCIDGVCCDTACTEACKACDLPSNAGTCSPISGAPRVGHASCAPYRTCSAGACGPSCTSDASCASSAWCEGSTCTTKKAQGATCAGDVQCASGFCRDGRCCGGACDGQCEACGESGSLGTCVAVKGAPRASRAACTGGEGACAARCDGANRRGCAFAPAVTTCGADACAGGIETHARTCDGVGHCNDVPRACGEYACGSGVCLDRCTTGSDCAAGFVCSGTSCVPAPGLGESCTAKPCLGALTCVDGVCCATASCPSGSACALPASKGRCAKKNGETCAADGECGSGACVDGVCCESTCSGQCQACDVPGKAGQCVAVKGEPQGKRPKCAAGASTCEAATCDGVDASRCAGLPGPETECTKAACAAGIRAEPAHCSGAGACGEPTTTPCSPYACDVATAACRTSCAATADCADGMVCESGACATPTTTCSDDGADIIDPLGHTASCAPLLCRAGACLEKCASTLDCVAGTACSGGSCVALAPSQNGAGEGGCGHSRASHASRAGARAGWLLVAAALWAVAARRGRA